MRTKQGYRFCNRQNVSLSERPDSKTSALQCNSDKTLIICYGNDLVGNDAFGRAVYDTLPNCENKIFTHQLLPELLEIAKEYKGIIFVDASIGGLDPDFFEVFADFSDSSNLHHLTPQLFLSLLKSIYSRTPVAHVCCAYFDKFEIGELDKQFDQRVKWARELLKKYCSIVTTN
jgi:Ni,Fe-hydrogenase maturation factor